MAEAEGRHWLFLEKLPGTVLDEIGDRTCWAAAARWLAATHVRLAREPAALAQATTAAHLLRYDPSYYRRWLRRALTFARTPGATGLRAQRAGNAWDRRRQRPWLEWLAGHHERLVERLLALPQTFIHGEFYASNVLVLPAHPAQRARPSASAAARPLEGPSPLDVEREGRGHAAGGRSGRSGRSCPVDWETAAVGPGLVDLAALTAGNWTEAERIDLALTYYQALAAAGGQAGMPANEAAFLEALDYCRLHLAVQWMGWSATWSPPAYHAHDWCTEAMHLADKVGW